ncbi:Type-1 angiotensin II receptor-associated protein-like [Lamellibrachia satsuma]|nr:Type-1 angiotensin II receptor-associated protein-like [Lamellibrachia satsuma]
MVHAPQVALKVVVIVHFILTVWASMVGSPFLPTSYIYMNAFILAFGFWAIVTPESTDAILMFLLLNVISIVMDIIFLSIYTPKAHSVFDAASYSQSSSEYHFCLGMAIVNLLFKPFSSFVLFRLYQERGGNYADLSIPGLPDFGLGGVPAQNRYQSQGGGYQNPNQLAPAGVIETPTPHSMFDQSPPTAPPPK